MSIYTNKTRYKTKCTWSALKEIKWLRFQNTKCIANLYWTQKHIKSLKTLYCFWSCMNMCTCVTRKVIWQKPANWNNLSYALQENIGKIQKQVYRQKPFTDFCVGEQKHFQFFVLKVLFSEIWRFFIKDSFCHVCCTKYLLHLFYT